MAFCYLGYNRVAETPGNSSWDHGGVYAKLVLQCGLHTADLAQ